MNGRHVHAEVLSTLLLSALLTACGGGGSGSSSSGSGSNGGSSSTSSSYTVGGSVSGLNGAASLSLNGGPAQSVSSDGSFVFSSNLASGDAYAVTAPAPWAPPISRTSRLPALSPLVLPSQRTLIPPRPFNRGTSRG